jgi:hypothetical protein
LAIGRKAAALRYRKSNFLLSCINQLDSEGYGMLVLDVPVGSNDEISPKGIVIEHIGFTMNIKKYCCFLNRVIYFFAPCFTCDCQIA